MPSNLSLGKLKRAVDGTNSYTTANTSLGAQNDGSSETKMSDFTCGTIGSLTISDDGPGTSASGTATLAFSSQGSLFTDSGKGTAVNAGTTLAAATVYYEHNNSTNFSDSFTYKASDDEDDSPDFLSENLQPAATVTRTESLPIPRNLETVTVNLDDVKDDALTENSINIFGSTNFPEGADDIEGELPVGSTELESVPALDEFEIEEITELESNDGANTSRDEDEYEAEDSVEEETKSLLSLSGMMKFVSSMMFSNVKGAKEETETSSEGEKALSTPTLKPDLNATPSTSSVEVNPQIKLSQEPTFLPNDGDDVQEEYQDDEQVQDFIQDPVSIIESAQTEGESTPDDLMEKEVDKMMDDMLPGPANSHEDMPSGSSEIIGRNQLGSKFKPLVIKVLGSFKSSNLSLNEKVEKLRRVLISESPSIIR